MKYLLSLYILVFSVGSYSNETEESTKTFKSLLDENQRRIDIKEIADRETEITRAAKAIRDRIEMGVVYNGDGTFNVVDTDETASVSVDKPVATSFRFPSNEVLTEPSLPKLIGVINNTAKLEYLGVVKEYENGDKVGDYFIDRVTINYVYLRDKDSKRHVLKNSW
jgi:DNA/RNA endonuclease YhcR with UshA esterase domain